MSTPMGRHIGMTRMTLQAYLHGWWTACQWLPPPTPSPVQPSQSALIPHLYSQCNTQWVLCVYLGEEGWSGVGGRGWERGGLCDMYIYRPDPQRSALSPCLWMASWRNQCRSTNACRSQQQATWHRDLHRRLSHKGPVWLGVHSQAGWKDCARRQWSPRSHDL